MARRSSLTFRTLLAGVVVVLSSCHAKEPWSGVAADASQQGAQLEGGMPTFEVHVVDVGCGLAVFVEGPDFALIYDGGSADETALGSDNRFVAYLDALHPGTPQRIDHVIVSHPHTDHVLLLPDVLALHPIGDVWESGVAYDSCPYQDFLMAVEKCGATYHSQISEPGEHAVALAPLCTPEVPQVVLRHGTRVVSGTEIRLGLHASMVFLYANGAPLGDANDNSMVVRLDLGGHRVLLMGDASGGSERDALNLPESGSIEAKLLMRPAELDADVLVVGHHGGRAGSHTAFLDAVSPHISIIPSCPRYGSPHADVVRELSKRSSVFRTDIDDEACRKDPNKIGVPADGQPGGCSNVRTLLSTGAEPVARYWKRAP